MKMFLAALVLSSGIAHAEMKNASEAGIVLKGGNSRSQVINLKQESTYAWNLNQLSFSAAFLRAKAEEEISAKQWKLVLRYDRTISYRWDLFLAEGAEGDRFKGFRRRYNTDVGSKYWIIKDNEKWSWLAEAGYRYTRENWNSEGRVTAHKARVYTEANYRWNESSSSKLWLEFLPNFTRQRDWLLNAEFSTSVRMSNLLSVKLAYLLEYDREPNPGAIHRQDHTFTTSLIAAY